MDTGRKIINAINLNKRIKVEYETLKNMVGYEDIFYENHLIPFLEANNLEHEFCGKYILLRKKGE